MPRTTKTITFSLPPEMAVRVDEAMKQQGKSQERVHAGCGAPLHRGVRVAADCSSTERSGPGNGASARGTWLT